MYSVFNDERAYVLATVMEEGKIGSGVEFLLSYWEKKGALKYVSRIHSFKKGSTWDVQFSKIPYVLLLEEMFEKVETKFDSFFLSLNNQQTNIDPTASKIRDAEKRVHQILSKVNSIIVSNSEPDVMYEQLNREIGQSNCPIFGYMIDISAHCKSYKTNISTNITSFEKFFVEINFNSSSRFYFRLR